MSTDIEAIMWGLLCGGGLITGAALAWIAKPSARSLAAVMAFGSGILLSALVVGLLADANRTDGLLPAIGGFMLGAVIFTVGALIIHGRKRRRYSERYGASDSSPFSIVLATVIDGVPEAIVVGLTLAKGSGAAAAIAAAIFVSNVPEALSATAGMRQAGRKPMFVFGLWSLIAIATGLAALLGYRAFADAAPSAIAFMEAVAGGAILAMLANTMIPEAFAEEGSWTGLVVAVGFVAGLPLSS